MSDRQIAREAPATHAERHACKRAHGTAFFAVFDARDALVRNFPKAGEVFDKAAKRLAEAEAEEAMTLGAAHTARVHDRVCSWRQANLKQMNTGKFLLLTPRDAARPTTLA